MHDLTVPARKRIGVLTPSSNTALEPLVSAMLSRVSGVSVHYSRFGVTEISLRQHSLAQFDDSKILEAARLLADARVDVIDLMRRASGFDRCARHFQPPFDAQLIQALRHRLSARAGDKAHNLTRADRARNLNRKVKAADGRLH